MRSFCNDFQLANFVKMTEAHLESGLLAIDLVRELPEAMKPRKIEIGGKALKAIESPAKRQPSLELGHARSQRWSAAGLNLSRRAAR